VHTTWQLSDWLLRLTQERFKVWVYLRHTAQVCQPDAALLLLLAPLLVYVAACCQASLYGGLGTAAVLAVCTQLSYKQFQEKKPVSQPVTAVSLGVSAAVTVGMLHSCKAIGEHNKLAVAGAVLSTAFTGWYLQLESAGADVVMVVTLAVVVLLLPLYLPAVLCHLYLAPLCTRLILLSWVHAQHARDTLQMVVLSKRRVRLRSFRDAGYYAWNLYKSIKENGCCCAKKA
jgi:hypothetical protein